MASARTALAFAALTSVLAGCTSGPGPVANPTAAPGTVSATLGATASPSPGDAPASQQTVVIPALTATFTSPRMGYSVRYPPDWTATPATRPWTPGASNFWDDPVGDRLEAATVGFRGTSQALAKGQSAAAWLAAYFGSGPSCGDPEQVSMAQTAGTIGMNGCTGLGRLGGRVFDLAIVVGRHGYNFTMEGAVDHALFLAMLATVTFAPSTAIDAPGG